jgi:hypothetical protein
LNVLTLHRAKNGLRGEALVNVDWDSRDADVVLVAFPGPDKLWVGKGIKREVGFGWVALDVLSQTRVGIVQARRIVPVIADGLIGRQRGLLQT